MAKSVKLSLKPEFDFTLLGIVSSEPIYRLAWLLNDTLKTTLSESTMIQMYHSKKCVIQDFAYFSEKVEGDVVVELVANKGPHGLLIEEHKQIDFFLKIYNLTEDFDKLKGLLKGIKNISLALEIKPGSLKSIDRLTFRVEED